MERDPLKITGAWKVIDAQNACFDDSRFVCVGAERMYLENVSLVGTKITNANLTELEIENAQMSGAYFHDIGLPPEGDPLNKLGSAKPKPIRFEYCDLNGARISECNLSHVEIRDCELLGMKINGILVEDLLKAYDTKIK